MTQYNPFSIAGPDINAAVRLTREYCVETINGQGDAPYQATVQCILTKLTAYELAIVSSRQYILTLWPAFVGAICAFGPDPSNMVYDNVWWSVLFSMTCAGLPGGRNLCKLWLPVERAPQEASRSWVLASTPPRRSLVITEWICFLIGVSMYLAFSFWFAYTLRSAFIIASWPQYWLAVAAWYWLSPAPALAAVVLSEAWQNRVELYEPRRIHPPAQSQSSEIKGTGFVSSGLLPAAFLSVTTTLPMTPERASVLAVPYDRVDTPTIFHVWTRVIMHQWNRRYYRLLVKPSSDHPYFLFIRLGVGLGRIAVFVWGSTWMGDILLMPMPQDLLLLVLLVFTSAVPRIVFPRLWSNGARGADLVVCVKPVGTADY